MKTAYLTEAKILKCIAENPGISAVKIHEKLNFSLQTIYNRLKWIRNNEYLSQFLTEEKEGKEIFYSFDTGEMVKDLNKDLEKENVHSEVSEDDLLTTFYGVVWAQRINVIED